MPYYIKRTKSKKKDKPCLLYTSYKDADGKVRSGVRYNVVELDAAAFKCNYMNTLSRCV